VARTHHERWDGAGYPNGLAGEAIPLPGRIAAVCDVYDALTHERPYKRAWTVEEACAEIERGRDAHFDGRVVDAFFAVLQRQQADAAPATAVADADTARASDQRRLAA
jgi:putative two-component system response regulator